MFNNYLKIADPPELHIKIKQKRENVHLKYSWRKVLKNFNMPVNILYGDGIIRLYPTVKKQKTVVPLIEGEEMNFNTSKSYFVISGK